jgi:hypothetical protein
MEAFNARPDVAFRASLYSVHDSSRRHWQPALLPFLSVPIAVFAGLAVLGTVDLVQTRHAVLRNDPISAHLRFMLEKIRPEMRQYFFEDEKHGLPFVAGPRCSHAPAGITLAVGPQDSNRAR